MAGEGIEVPAEFQEILTKMFKEGFIYQRFQHTCGYKGNAYHKQNGKWDKRTHCPQCKEELKWVLLEQVLIPMIERACGPDWKPPKLTEGEL